MIHLNWIAALSLSELQIDPPSWISKGRPTEGTGCCYATESIDLLALEWCIQMHDYKELRELTIVNSRVQPLKTLVMTLSAA
ncbi:hypothetical protein ANCDUO_12432 [Ancylostoma duodenale]|uniref:Uncharacterized protein n=1 Tax=Ancylostoma duodenale TaxID=51022 RepID=A0A0C2GK02_9BILA|nr:hypothetical protein ANCDUO_12432 [Ancylostoma duodenale]